MLFSINFLISAFLYQLNQYCLTNCLDLPDKEENEFNGSLNFNTIAQNSEDFARAVSQDFLWWHLISAQISFLSVKSERNKDLSEYHCIRKKKIVCQNMHNNICICLVVPHPADPDESSLPPHWWSTWNPFGGSIQLKRLGRSGWPCEPWLCCWA